MLRIFSYLIACALFGSRMDAQLRFRHLSVDDGLSQNSVNCITPLNFGVAVGAVLLTQQATSWTLFTALMNYGGVHRRQECRGIIQRRVLFQPLRKRSRAAEKNDAGEMMMMISDVRKGKKTALGKKN